MLKNFLAGIFLPALFISSSIHAQKTDLSVADFEKGIHKNGIQILDVRTQNEYNSGHVKDALLADWTNEKVFEERVKSLDKNKPVYTYCLSGARSNAAAARLREKGFTEVHNLQGGIMAWKAANKPVEGVADVRQITMAEYLSQIPADKTVLVDIGAVWCPPCKKMDPVIKELVQTKKDGLKLVRIDGGTQEKLAAQLNALSFPTFIIYKKGKEVWRQTGIVSKEELMQQLK